MPQDLDSLNTAYGSEADLRACLAALHDHNILAIADVVINHRCAQQKASLAWTGLHACPSIVTSMLKPSILPMVAMRSA
jgi:Alpha amylase, catalytic domain